MKTEKDKDFLKKMGEKIKIARKSKCMSLRKLSDKIGYSTTTISEWERGLKTPSILAVKELQRVLRVRI